MKHAIEVLEVALANQMANLKQMKQAKVKGIEVVDYDKKFDHHTEFISELEEAIQILKSAKK